MNDNLLESCVGGRELYDVTHAKCENNSVAARAVQASPGNKIISDISSSSGTNSISRSGGNDNRRCFIYFLTFTICILQWALYSFLAHLYMLYLTHFLGFLSRTYLYTDSFAVCSMLGTQCPIYTIPSLRFVFFCVCSLWMYLKIVAHFPFSSHFYAPSLLLQLYCFELFQCDFLLHSISLRLLYWIMLLCVCVLV